MQPIPDNNSNNTNTSTTYIFAGGGSGGHIFPGLAIAERLLKPDPASPRRNTNPNTTRCLFLCSDRTIDAKILTPLAQRAATGNNKLDSTNSGLWWEPTHAKPFSTRPLGLIKFAHNWGYSVREARRFIREARTLGDVKIAAMGGFVAAPVAQAARVERTTVMLVNLDAVPGKANNFIASRVPHILTAAEGNRIPSTWTRVGPIVRRAALPPADKHNCRQQLGLDPNRPTLMIVGASQGAASIDRFITAIATTSAPAQRSLQNWQILHQCGSDESLNNAQSAYNKLNIPSILTRFVDNIGLWWGSADLAITRAGAGMVAEVLATRTPTLFMPYPFHKDLHQKHNAEPLASVGGAAIATDHIEPDQNLSNHANELNDLLSNPARLAAMRQALAKLAPSDGAETCANHLINLQPPTR